MQSLKKAWALDDGLVLNMPLFKAVSQAGVASWVRL